MDCMRSQIDEHVLLDGRYQTVSPLNHGSFGMVFVARDVTTDEMVAIKCLTKPSAAIACPASMNIDEHSEELAIHSKIGHHPNIVNLMRAFETENHTYLVLEFCPNGDLYEAIRLDRGPLETEHVRDFMLQLVDAAQFMHSKGIYHRDIKPENIFLSSSGTLKLGDFGLATMDTWSTEFAVGSDRYMAPEQYAPVGYTYGYSPATADVWAIGICLLNILFSRNPFATPTSDDPLFADFARDRQSLFDVFPNMSQDTFSVLMPALAIDPAKRSLQHVREALYQVVSFTTDDEAIDEFCNEDRDPIPATLNREPLRTPSISSPGIENGGFFPWAKALQATPQKHARQLSVIPDNESYTEELFPEPRDAGKSWYGTDADSTSINSTLDSALGMSFKSANNSSDFIGHAPSRPVPISSSVPIKSSKAMASVYGNSDELFSKSWSDLWEEDEEDEQEQEQGRPSFEEALEIERAPTAKPKEPSPLSSVTAAIDIRDASRRSSTPRAGLTELKSTNVRSNSPEVSRRKLFGGQSKTVSASAPQKYSPPSKRSFGSDKWSVLGNLRRSSKVESSPPPQPINPRRGSKTETPVFLGNARRGSKTESPVTPQKPEKIDRFTLTPFTNSTKKPRERSGSWRKDRPAPTPYYQHTNHSGVSKNSAISLNSNDLWQTSRDWRQHAQPQHAFASSNSRPRTQPITCGPQLLKSTKHYTNSLDIDDDIGDLEWVGGWDNLHL